jgi:mono/diheme cytochrome c family protein/glucose/arabinose dehydrogenase
MRNKELLLFCVWVVSILFSCKPKEIKYQDEIYIKPKIDPNPVLKYQSPEESLNSLHLPKGYHAELVANEPMINEPVSIAWDGNGKMYVAQMMTYMQDADATNENQPWSRISLLEDTDGDGRMDKSSVFIDSMVLPRILLPLDDRVLVGETFQRNLYSYRDTNTDGVADEKILLLEDTVRDNRNLEHQDASMLWSIDNWLYVTNKAFRYRFVDNKLIRDTLPEPGVGQWGLTQDETGRIFYSRAGAEIPALGFQQHPIYGSLELPNQWDESFMEPWPIVGTPDAQGGPRRMREGDNTLNRFTGVSGQELFLGDQLPAYGDLFIPEPVGRLIRRAKVKHVDAKIILESAYPQTEFLASTDPLFRPVYSTTGPDGCLYVVDMYRGIIQEGQWVGKGSYLRGIVDERGYDKFTSKGRIYRIVHDQMQRGERPKLLDKSADELLPFLGHPNGWWRNTAQKLIVLKGDQSVVPDLKNVVENNETFFAKLFYPNKKFGLERLHALWTLEGLNAIDPIILKKAFLDKDARVRGAAIRISERYVKQKDQDMMNALKTLAADTDPEVLQQLILTLRFNNNEESKRIAKSILDKYPNNEVIKVTAGENLNPSFNRIKQLRDQYRMRGGDAAIQIVNGYRIFEEYCSTCHGKDGMGIKQLAPPLVGSPRLTGDVEVTAKILLHGLTGPVDGIEYNGPMAPNAQQSDEYIADVISYIREHLNHSGTVWRGRIRQVREKNKGRNTYWTLKELKETANK